MTEERVSAADQAAVSAQLGRTARGIRSIAHRCSCGLPDVVETEPRLADGTPFPTTFYITCPRLASAIGTLEAGGMMKEMTERLGTDEELAKAYQAAHESYLAHRESIEHVTEIDGITAGGMPTRVKCLHVLVGHSLAVGPGVNPLGDEALEALSDWGRRGPCVSPTDPEAEREPTTEGQPEAEREAGVVAEHPSGAAGVVSGLDG
ncbi:hypothetical protein EV138_4957 [Kribbella voronezhensis]|uniref:DUF501 domain-containing protein n=1 Tax=Kribbella voronezhensis TaxID=2512212 RepID=A0A4R7TGD8_9ACTN|nr:DUF501 domain-containing protein [Kribbella voronezhensis]TDU91352.1 hypothetical protein EV138_4957 [Kribbella voronezhensis]